MVNNLQHFGLKPIQARKHRPAGTTRSIAIRPGTVTSAREAQERPPAG